MGGNKVRDVAHISFAAPDLAPMRVLLKDCCWTAAPGGSDELPCMKIDGPGAIEHACEPAA